jgi:hypothetical protein
MTVLSGLICHTIAFIIILGFNPFVSVHIKEVNYKTTLGWSLGVILDESTVTMSVIGPKDPPVGQMWRWM